MPVGISVKWGRTGSSQPLSQKSPDPAVCLHGVGDGGGEAGVHSWESVTGAAEPQDTAGGMRQVPAGLLLSSASL